MSYKVDQIISMAGNLTHDETVNLLELLINEFRDEAELSEAIINSMFDPLEVIAQLEEA